MSATSAFAATTVQTCPTGDFSALCKLSEGNLNTIVGGVLSLLLVIAVFACLFFLIWGGIKWITSGGDKTAVEGARNHITAAVIGLIVSFISFFILNIVTNIFLGKSIAELNIPTLIP